MGIKLPAAGLALASAALLTACGASEDDLRKSQFYVDGTKVHTILQSELTKTAAGIDSCETGLKAVSSDTGRAKPRPETDEDRDAFMLGCKEGEQVR